MKMYFHAMNVKPYYISPMNHGSNRAERYIRTLNDIICKNLTGIGGQMAIICIAFLLGNEHPSFKGYRILTI